MIVLFTDFGLEGPYTGQMKAVLYREAPGVAVVDLFADLPAFDAQGAAYLLAAYADAFPAGTVFLCVVDPGVGSERRALVVEAGGRWYVGPDNGLLRVVAERAPAAHWWEITWRPPALSASFHGRDVFAPVAARLAREEPVPGVPLDGPGEAGAGWPADLSRIVYLDRYGNAMTGLRAAGVHPDTVVSVAGHRLTYARTFAEVPPGGAFWYPNANGLVELAVNEGRADRDLGVTVGDPVALLPPAP